MSMRQLIDEILQYATNRRTQMKEHKNISRQRQTSAGTTVTIDGVCGACGGEIVEVNKNTHRRVCIKCGKEAK